MPAKPPATSGARMYWNRLYGLRSYVRSSLWLVPLIALPLNFILTRIIHALGVRLGWDFMGFGLTGAQALFEAILTMALSFLVFTFGSLLVVIQVASGQLTSRVIATTLLRDKVVRYTVGLFTLTLLFAVSALGRLEGTVNQFALFVAALLGLSCLAAFLYLIDYTARRLRPISILMDVGNAGLAVIDSLYRHASITPDPATQASGILDRSTRVVTQTGSSEIILAIQVGTLVDLAKTANGIIEFVPLVGDFVAAEDPLFKLHGGASAIDDEKLRATVAFGSERTVEQDPTFSFRIVVDIALRALSPAINDPTTAVLALDQLHRMLRKVGQRTLHTHEVCDTAGELRVIIKSPCWEDFVHLALCEIRYCGSNNMQIVRRMRSMLDNLLETLPRHRHPPLLQELSLLDREAARHFIYPEDLALARIGDSQGLGGHAVDEPAHRTPISTSS